MKSKQIVFRRAGWDETNESYIVEKLVNRVRPLVGSLCAVNVVKEYTLIRDINVTVLPPHKTL